jgi:hypothetical protein
MAIILDAPVSPQDLTIITRNLPVPGNLLLQQILPDRQQAAMEVDFAVVTKTGNTARFRPWDAPAHITPRNQVTLNRAPLMPLSAAKPVITEQDAARLYGLQQGAAYLERVAETIYGDVEDLTADVHRRAELARGTVLSTGQLALNEGGLSGTIDYMVPGSNKVTAPILWSSTGTADIVTYLNTLRLQYIALNGFAPGGMILSSTVLGYMQQNTKLQSMAVQQFGPNMGGYAGLLPRNALDAIFGAYNLPPITLVYDTQVNVDGPGATTNYTRVIPNNVVILLPPADQPLGYTAWGPTVTAMKLVGEGNLGEVAPGITAFVDRGDEFPYKTQTFVDSLMLPVIENGNLLMIVTVA